MGIDVKKGLGAERAAGKAKRSHLRNNIKIPTHM